MTWVLIYTAFVFNGGAVSVNQEFDSEAACKAALTEVVKPWIGDVEPVNTHVVSDQFIFAVACLPKG